MTKLNRRSFLKTSIAAGASMAVLPGFAAESSSARTRVVGANGDIRYAVVGFGGRGKDHLEEMREQKGTRLVALCDVDRDTLNKQLKRADELGEHVKGYTDVRKLLEDKDIDVVTFATPNHWHSLGSIWAIQSGKDVYVE